MGAQPGQAWRHGMEHNAMTTWLGMSVLELVAAAISILGIWLATRRSMATWPISVVADLLYGVVFLNARLYSDTLLQGFFLLLTLHGWWYWQRGLRQEDPRGELPIGEAQVRVEPLGGKSMLAALALGAASSALLGHWMARHTDAALPYADATLTCFSLVAQWWQNRKHTANWWLWILVDTLYTAMFVYKRLYPTAALYAILVALAALGLRDWRRAWNDRPAAKP